ncbi:MAG: phage terminase large subunit [Oscillospiraceae bacterium]
MIATLRPNPKQVEFLKARARFVAYGGARGGGKSWSIRQKAKLLALYYGGIRILILRRTFPELRENHILPLKKELGKLATWREGEKAFSFANGSRVVFGHCAGEHDVDQYQGQEYDIIFIDEATHFTEYQFSVLTACLRGANRFPKRMYLTCNPGGVGHMWVKRLFIDRAFRAEEDPEDYLFIQARASDNPALVENDPGYLKMLNNLPEGLREAWRDGRWDVFAGQYFPEFRMETHVVPPRALPARWPRYRVFDYGLDMLACFWAAIDHTGRIWVYRELCRSGLIVSDAAAAIRAMTPEGERIRCTIAPPDMWSTQKDSGRTMAELFAQSGVPLVKASNQRIQGWMAMKEFLKPTDGELPGLVVTSDCKQFIRDVSAVQHDEKEPADVAKEPHEYTHTTDAIRYLCAFRALGADPPRAEEDEEDGTAGYDRFMVGGDVQDGYLRYGN